MDAIAVPPSAVTRAASATSIAGDGRLNLWRMLCSPAPVWSGRGRPGRVARLALRTEPAPLKPSALSDVVHDRAGGAALALGDVGDGVLGEHRAGGGGGVGEDRFGAGA